ncbi:hypothetical protein PPL_06939 [Heterostelium album PN500]|uniref:Uncharacterized protein n=1 Tax=Heterostelium pallidum (strain ATCC 26659 / Pp 5 / PN500) TaxID=670386 RepID=D3BDY6_HETP5|nr:hypothetical protein PPL_06939 [Heterostelium album PN500]EFA80117.1 hypothetical protein PPL_06939 [Heterostelium album PN500]|eukprot:XP_020432237.1 hypothetical protein PPL_06939 [Heterostelium album PN500]
MSNNLGDDDLDTTNHLLTSLTMVFEQSDSDLSLDDEQQEELLDSLVANTLIAPTLLDYDSENVIETYQRRKIALQQQLQPRSGKYIPNVLSPIYEYIYNQEMKSNQKCE